MNIFVYWTLIISIFILTFYILTTIKIENILKENYKENKAFYYILLTLFSLTITSAISLLIYSL